MVSERIKELRAALGLNQRDFSDKVRIAQPTLAQFETGVRTPKDIHIAQICTAFNVNEEWLRTGEGDMFRVTDSGVLSQLANEYGLTALESSIIEAFITLPDEYREGVRQFVRALLDRQAARIAADPDADLRARLDAAIAQHENLTGEKNA